MQRDRLLLIVFLTLAITPFAFFPGAKGKLCGSINVRNNVTNLESLRNCSIVMGDVRILLMEKVQHHGEFEDYSFPELIEIEDYLLLYGVYQLKNIGTLFPNLAIIRGRKLFFAEYSIVAYRMPHLAQIGLKNLRRMRGGVRVENCPEICHVDSVNWTAMGASEKVYVSSKECADDCPARCKHCWNERTCQVIDQNKEDCHEECFGCSQPHSALHCHACRNYKVVKKGKITECVKTCPNDMLPHNYSMSCLYEEECTSLKDSWWVFRGNCVNQCPILYQRTSDGKSCEYCGEDCVIVCKPPVIKDKISIEELNRCTIINGTLEVRLKDPSLEPLLEQHASKIKEIVGRLKISRTALRSLNFLKKLETIKGIGNTTTDNKKDNSLYGVFINENQNLQKLWNFSSNSKLTIERGQIGIYYNSQLCASEIAEFRKHVHLSESQNDIIVEFSNGDKAACNWKNVSVKITEINSTNVTISWNESDFKINPDTNIIGYSVYYMKTEGENITTFDSKDVCGTTGWDSFFISHKKNYTETIKHLEPYTRYGFYIKPYVDSSPNSKVPTQTIIYNFMTASDDPTEPVGFTAKAVSEFSIKLSWSPPVKTNGNLSYYLLTSYLQPDSESLISQRNYCRHEHLNEDLITLAPKVKVDEIDDDNCTCSSVAIFKKEMMKLCKRPDDANCENFMYKTDLHTSLMVHTIEKREIGDPSGSTIKIDNPVNNSYLVQNLTHFSLYIFFLRACNVDSDGTQKCGPVEMATERTLKWNSADIIEHIGVNIVDNSYAELQWSISKTNSLIVAFYIATKRKDIENAIPKPKCITKRECVYQNGYYRYKTEKLMPGDYSIKVQAVFLSGPGLFSVPVNFTIDDISNSNVWLTIGIFIIFIVLVIIVVIVARNYWKKRYGIDSNHLITSINPEYAGLVYQEDDWEIAREDIIQIRTIGEGTFGMVYEGRIKSRNNCPCAVKTVNENASMMTRMEFLREGSRMKAFNEAHHVVKLLGIVSRGQPPLVIMELMERGDLKKYLLLCREPSQNLTTNELYRMAAEIADGMAFLAAQKFVHRDLAARNIMVAGDRTVKIGDFGMARDIYETDYYRKDTVGLLPIRWMAPESLADGVFTSDSDCWSYGVVLWEMATLGQQPYQGRSNEEVFNLVKSGGRLSRPSECSDFFYEVMEACWAWRPNDRPTFKQIVDKFVDHVGEGFRLVAFCYSRKGVEHFLNAGPRPLNRPAQMHHQLPEDDCFGYFDTAEEQVGLHVPDSNRPRFLPYSNQRHSQPYFSPGSPDSEPFSLGTSE